MKSHKRVLVIAGEYPPLKTIGRIRTAKFVQHMRNLGWKPYVLTVEYTTSDANYFEALEAEIPSDINVFRVKNDTYDELLIGKLKSFLKRKAIDTTRTPQNTACDADQNHKSNNRKRLKDFILKLYKSFFRQWVNIPDDYIIWSHRAYAEAQKIIHQHKIDLIYTSLPPISACITGYKLKNATGIPWIVDYRDLWTGDVLREWINPLRNSYEVYLEKKLIKKADVVIAVSEQKTQYLKNLHSSARCKWVTLTNGYDADVFEPLLKDRKQSGEPGIINFVYTGRLFKNRRGYAFAEALGEIYKAFPDLANSVRVEIFGGVSSEIKKRYDEILNNYKIQHLYNFHGDVSYECAMRAQIDADYLLLIVDTGSTSDGVIPGKLFEYIASKRPIFALCNDGATKDIIENANAGVVVPVDSMTLCKDTLQKLLEQEVPETLSVNLDYLEQFDRVTISKRLVEVFNQAVAKKQTLSQR